MFFNLSIYVSFMSEQKTQYTDEVNWNVCWQVLLSVLNKPDNNDYDMIIKKQKSYCDNKNLGIFKCSILMQDN